MCAMRTMDWTVITTNTAPSLSWDAFLKCVDGHFEEKLGTASSWSCSLTPHVSLSRGQHQRGLSQISKRHAVANKQIIFLPDSTQPRARHTSCISMRTICMGLPCAKSLPMKGFKWNEEKWTDDKIFMSTISSDEHLDMRARVSSLLSILFLRRSIITPYEQQSRSILSMLYVELGKVGVSEQ